MVIKCLFLARTDYINVYTQGASIQSIQDNKYATVALTQNGFVLLSDMDAVWKNPFQ